MDLKAGKQLVLFLDARAGWGGVKVLESVGVVSKDDLLPWYPGGDNGVQVRGVCPWPLRLRDCARLWVGTCVVKAFCPC